MSPANPGKGASFMGVPAKIAVIASDVKLAWRGSSYITITIEFRVFFACEIGGARCEI